MTHTTEPAPRPQPVRRRILARVLAGSALLVLLVFAVLKLYLVSPLAPRHLSRLLTDALGSPVTVAALENRGGAVVIRGLSIANPPGFSAAPLVRVDTLAVAPRWLSLLGGGRRFRRIELDGARIALEKNGSGAWNLAELQRRLPRREAPAAEVRIDELLLRAGEVFAAGRGVTGIGLRLRDLATRGSVGSRLELAFADGAGNRYRIEGETRPGPGPAFDLLLTAPSLTLAPLADMLRRPELSLERGGAALRLRVALSGGVFTADGTMDFRSVALRSGAAKLPLSGRLELRGGYDPARDEARLSHLAVTLADLAAARLNATVSRVRSKRSFTADVSLDQVALERLSPLVSAVTGRPLLLAGRLGSRGLRITGDGDRGVTGVAGVIAARELAVSLGGRPVFRGLAGTVDLAPDRDGFVARGNFATQRATADALIQQVSLPCTLLLSNRFRLREVQVPALAARIMGLPVTGRLGYRPASPQPLAASLRVSAMSLSPLAPHLSRYGLRPLGGTAVLTLDLGGKGVTDFAGEAFVTVDSLAVDARGERAALGAGEVRSRFRRTGKRLTAAGTARFDGAEWGESRGGLAASFAVADRTLVLDDLRAAFAATAASAGRVTLALPGGMPGAASNALPLSVGVAAGAVRHGDLEVRDLSASFRGNLRSTTGERWLEGGGEVSAGRLAIRGIPAGAPSLTVALARTTGEAELGGTLLGGVLSGRATFKPVAPGAGITFSLGLRGGKLAEAGRFIPGKPPVAPAGGAVSGTVSGTFSRSGGLLGRIEVSADGVALNGGGGKRILSGGGARLAGRVEGERLVLQEGVVTAGEGATLWLRGSMDEAFSPRRAGSLAFSLPPTPIDRLIDPVVNVLPRFIQEATVAGNVAAEGTATLSGSAGAVDGTLTFDGAGIEIPSQKLLVGGVRGTVPLSLGMGAGPYRRPKDELHFTKENFGRLLERFRQPRPADRVLTVGAVRFGPLELGETTAFLRGGNGVMELTSLRSGLSGGEVLGRGFVATKGGLSYGGAILVYDLSMTRLCDAIPQIKGYVSGRLDGIVGLQGDGEGIGGLRGFVDLWARNTRREKMLLSREFLQRLAGKNLRGFFFRTDRPYDRGEVSAYLEDGYLTFTTLDISNTNLLGMRDLSVTVVPVQNRISLEHLFSALKEATTRGKAAVRDGGAPAAESPAETEFQWRD
uniref:Uncharacterized protein n=1 Tax=Geobacter metallireducens TaxID=28232 RepID=A0A831U4T3_GEOME